MYWTCASMEVRGCHRIPDETEGESPGPIPVKDIPWTRRQAVGYHRLAVAALARHRIQAVRPVFSLRSAMKKSLGARAATCIARG